MISEKCAAAREKQAADEEVKDIEATVNVEDTKTIAKPDAEKASGNVKLTENVDKTRKDEEPVEAEKVEAQEKKDTAERATEVTEEATARKVELENIDDEFCTDDVYDFDSKETKSVGSQTLESGPLPNTPSRPGFDYYSLQYDDFD